MSAVGEVGVTSDDNPFNDPNWRAARTQEAERDG